MTNQSDNQFNKNYQDEIDLSELLETLWSRKLTIGIITSLFIFFAILISLMMPNIYKSSATMMPVEASSTMSGMLGQYSGMASLAGISLPSETGTKAQEAIARIQSFEFFSNYFLPNISLEDILAVKKWDSNSNTLIYDERDFNASSGKWIREAKPPRQIVPSAQEAYEEYIKIMSISEDKKTLFVSLSIEHKSPFVAQRWVELIINQIDKVIRNEDKQEATRSVDYLNSLASTVNYEEIKKTLSSLQEEHMKRLMMVEANENYIFKVLDSPIVPEIKSKPRRSIIVLLGAILGIIFSIFVTLAHNYLNKPHKD